MDTVADIVVDDLGGLPLIRVEGEIDRSTCHNLERALDSVLATGSTVVALDLSGLSYLDSGGVSVLLSATRRLRNVGWLAVLGANSNLSRLFELVGLMADPGFRVFEDRAALQRAVSTLEEVED